MNKYELTLLIHPERETDLEAPLERVRSLIKDNGGSVASENAMGKKRLAYQIEKQDFAIYQYMDVELPPAAPLVISNTLNITEGVLRYLLVKRDEKVQAAKESSAKRKANRE